MVLARNDCVHQKALIDIELHATEGLLQGHMDDGRDWRVACKFRLAAGLPCLQERAQFQVRCANMQTTNTPSVRACCVNFARAHCVGLLRGAHGDCKDTRLQRPPMWGQIDLQCRFALVVEVPQRRQANIANPAACLAH